MSSLKIDTAAPLLVSQSTSWSNQRLQKRQSKVHPMIHSISQMIQPTHVELIAEKRQQYRNDRGVHRKAAKAFKRNEIWKRPTKFIIRKAMEFYTYLSQANRQSALVRHTLRSEHTLNGSVAVLSRPHACTASTGLP